MKLADCCSVIRSKNSGPYELTFDMIFRERPVYDKVKEQDVFSADRVCGLIGIAKEDIIAIVYFDPANAVKITIRRPLVSGDIGESDIYGAQQHGSLMDLEFALD